MNIAVKLRAVSGPQWVMIMPYQVRALRAVRPGKVEFMMVDGLGPLEWRVASVQAPQGRDRAMVNVDRIVR